MLLAVTVFRIWLYFRSWTRGWGTEWSWNRFTTPVSPRVLFILIIVHIHQACSEPTSSALDTDDVLNTHKSSHKEAGHRPLPSAWDGPSGVSKKCHFVRIILDMSLLIILCSRCWLDFKTQLIARLYYLVFGCLLLLGHVFFSGCLKRNSGIGLLA